jgi:hypothetical protein
VGVDVGGVGKDSPRDILNRRVVNFVAGVNLGLGPILLRLHFARPFNTGAPLPVPEGEWVTNFSIGMAGFPGFGRISPNGSAPTATPLQPPRL